MGRVSRCSPWWWVWCGCCGRVFGDHSWEGSCSFACWALTSDFRCCSWWSMTMYAMMMMTLVKIMMIDEADDDDDYLPPGRATSARRVSSGSVSGEEAGEIGDLMMTSLMITVMLTMMLMTLTNIMITMTNIWLWMLLQRERWPWTTYYAYQIQHVSYDGQVFPKSKNNDDFSSCTPALPV